MNVFQPDSFGPGPGLRRPGVPVSRERQGRGTASRFPVPGVQPGRWRTCPGQSGPLASSPRNPPAPGRPLPPAAARPVPDYPGRWRSRPGLSRPLASSPRKRKRHRAAATGHRRGRKMFSDRDSLEHLAGRVARRSSTMRTSTPGNGGSASPRMTPVAVTSDVSPGQGIGNRISQATYSLKRFVSRSPPPRTFVTALRCALKTPI